MNTAVSLDRRQLLGAGACAIAAPWIFTRRVSAQGEERPRSLVLLELNGGLDGLSALVPYEDDDYHRLRPQLGLGKDDVLPFADGLAFPQRMAAFWKLYAADRLAIVQSTGRPGATMSHFRELVALHEATGDGKPANDGWIGRLRSQVWGEDPRPELVTHVGVSPPRSLLSLDHPAFSFRSPQHLVAFGAAEPGASGAMSGEDGVMADEAMGGGSETSKLDEHMANLRIERIRKAQERSHALAGRVHDIVGAYETKTVYPRSQLAGELRQVAALIQAGFGARVYSVRHTSYDAHSVGCGCTTTMLGEMSEAVYAFLHDLYGTSAENDVLILAYSEFGRRVGENHSGGTDHGAAGPMWLIGKGVEPGLHGVRASCADLDENGNLRHHVDFRSVYGAVLDGWFGVPHERILGKRYAAPTVLRV